MTGSNLNLSVGEKIDFFNQKLDFLKHKVETGQWSADELLELRKEVESVEREAEEFTLKLASQVMKLSEQKNNLKGLMRSKVADIQKDIDSYQGKSPSDSENKAHAEDMFSNITSKIMLLQNEVDSIVDEIEGAKDSVKSAVSEKVDETVAEIDRKNEELEQAEEEASLEERSQVIVEGVVFRDFIEYLSNDCEKEILSIRGWTENDMEEREDFSLNHNNKIRPPVNIISNEDRKVVILGGKVASVDTFGNPYQESNLKKELMRYMIEN